MLEPSAIDNLEEETSGIEPDVDEEATSVDEKSTDEQLEGEDADLLEEDDDLADLPPEEQRKARRPMSSGPTRGLTWNKNVTAAKQHPLVTKIAKQIIAQMQRKVSAVPPEPVVLDSLVLDALYAHKEDLPGFMIDFSDDAESYVSKGGAEADLLAVAHEALREIVPQVVQINLPDDLAVQIGLPKIDVPEPEEIEQEEISDEIEPETIEVENVPDTLDPIEEVNSPEIPDSSPEPAVTEVPEAPAKEPAVTEVPEAPAKEPEQVVPEAPEQIVEEPTTELPRNESQPVAESPSQEQTAPAEKQSRRKYDYYVRYERDELHSKAHKAGYAKSNFFIAAEQGGLYKREWSAPKAKKYRMPRQQTNASQVIHDEDLVEPLIGEAPDVQVDTQSVEPEITAVEVGTEQAVQLDDFAPEYEQADITPLPDMPAPRYSQDPPDSANPNVPMDLNPVQPGGPQQQTNFDPQLGPLEDSIPVADHSAYWDGPAEPAA